MITDFIARRIGKLSDGAQANGRITPLGTQVSADVELPQTELARTGRLFYGGCQLAANAIAPDTALPTTTIKLGLFNGEQDGGRLYVLDHLHVFCVSGTPAASATLWACVSESKLATRVTANATGYDAAAAYGGKSKTNARWGTALTFPAGTVWHGIASIPLLAAANFGQGGDAFELRGSLVVPPGYAAGFAVLSGAGTTPLYAISARWAEIESLIE